MTVTAGLLVIVAAIAWWRFRASYGVKRGLPPGSLGFMTSIKSLTDPSFYARAAERYGPVFKSAQFHRSVVCIADLPLALDVLEQHASSLREPRQPFGGRSPYHAIAFLDDRNHPRYRAILEVSRVSRMIEDSRDGAADTIDVELTNAVAASRGTAFDPRPLIQRLSETALYRSVFGLRPGDPRADTFRAALAAVGPHRPELRVDDNVRLIDILQSSGRDLVANAAAMDQRSMLGAMLREDSRHLQDTTLLGNLALLVLVTRNNTRLTLLWVLKELLDHPAVASELQNASDPQFASHVVRETLRRHVSEFMNRETVAEVPVGSHRVPAGWLIRVCVREAHDSSSVFPEPHTFRPARFAAREFSRREFCPASDGVNSAIGEELAFMIATEFARNVATRWDGAITADGPAERSGYRHWRHWEPSPRFRVRLSRRAPST